MSKSRDDQTASAGVPIHISGVTKRYRTVRGGDVHALAEIEDRKSVV